MKTNYYTSQTMAGYQQEYPSAWIVDSKDRGRKKCLNNKVYLDDNQEFEIELYNPLTDSVFTELKINGKLASTNGLILRPGQRFYLNCFIDDKKKFIFRTYEIDGSESAQKAIENNGSIEVSFYRENTKKLPFTKPYYNGGSFGNKDYLFTGDFLSNCYYSNTINTSLVDLSNLFDNQQIRSINNQPKFRSIAKKEETGRIEKGNKSEQQFVTIDMDFETYPINKIEYKLLPNSKKPVETSEIKTIKNFCSNCGVKLTQGQKFCPTCGTRI